MYHIIPDIHGQAGKLDAMLDRLGWRRNGAGWRGPDPAREIVFLGDFIDRGPENARVLKRVRSLIDSGKAQAVMGNHEFNAILFHTRVEGAPLRAHSAKNLRQHATFLKEFRPGSAETEEAIGWIKTLPFYLDRGGFRAVHACWHPPSIERLAAELPEGRLSADVLNRSEFRKSALFDALQNLTSGLEAALPPGIAFFDKHGQERDRIRIGWWLERAGTWREIARSVPDVGALPETPLPERLLGFRYGDKVPVFFGHYWMSGQPVVEADYALCLDYSAGSRGPLLAYDLDPADPVMSARRIIGA